MNMTTNTNSANTITDEQIKQVYDTLSTCEDANKMPEIEYADEATMIQDSMTDVITINATEEAIVEDIIAGNAYAETAEDIAYVETVESIEDNDLVALDEDGNVINVPADADMEKTIAEIKETDDNIREVLKETYGVDDAEAVDFMTLLNEYRSNPGIEVYSRLPKEMRRLVDSLVMTNVTSASRATVNRMRKETAKMMVDQVVNDAKLSAAIDEFNNELHDTVKEWDTEYSNIISKSMDDIFNKIDEIEATDPEQAAKIRSIKDAFDNAFNFDVELEYIRKTSAKKFSKMIKRFDSWAYYFNSKVNKNSFGVKISDIEKLVPIIITALPQYDKDTILKFIVAICVCVDERDVTQLATIARYMKMVSTIEQFGFVQNKTDDIGVFEKISKVIDEIPT